MNQDSLHNLIERYFDGETSVKEEKDLLKALLSQPDGDPKKDEVLAVMGYSAMIPKAKLAGKIGWVRYAASAAVILILAIVGLTVWESVETGINNECYAYVNGQRVENETQIRLLVESQLEEMSEASDEIQNQISADFNDFRDILGIN